MVEVKKAIKNRRGRIQEICKKIERRQGKYYLNKTISNESRENEQALIGWHGAA